MSPPAECSAAVCMLLDCCRPAWGVCHTLMQPDQAVLAAGVVPTGMFTLPGFTDIGNAELAM